MGTWLYPVILPCRQVSGTHFKIRPGTHRFHSSMIVRSSNKFQWLGTKIGYQDGSPSNVHQGDMSCFHSGHTTAHFERFQALLHLQINGVSSNTPKSPHFLITNYNKKKKKKNTLIWKINDTRFYLQVYGIELLGFRLCLIKGCHLFVRVW